MAGSWTLNILIVHGIGWGQEGTKYAHPLQRNIGAAFERALGRLRLRDIRRSDADPRRALRFAAVHWGPVTQASQDALLALMGFRAFPLLRRLNLAYQARRQMVGLLGDVIGYEGGPHNRVYQAIHRCVDKRAAALGAASATERSEDGLAPLTVIGHSLGSVIASDYIWDHTREATEPYHLAEHRLALKNLILMGSPMALYTLRNNPAADRQTLAASLDSPVQVDPDGGLWLNLYDPQDPIAFPLQPLESYARAGVIDCAIKAGNWLTTWNPASHVGYWRSDEVAEIIGRKLALDWAALNSPAYAGERYARDVAALRKELARWR
ncbi:MAG: hypothetical protein AB1435_11160 [Chloroflexota bacterium]